MTVNHGFVYDKDQPVAKAGYRETETITIEVKSDEGEMRRLLERIAQHCRNGHSFSVLVDAPYTITEKYKHEDVFGFDGDGATRVEVK